MIVDSSETALWVAPYVAQGKFDAVIEIPGSKSIMARALILAALSKNPSTIINPLRSRDSKLMRDGLIAMGVEITESEDHLSWHVMPNPLKGPALVDVGNAGTVMRFLPVIAAMAEGPVTFDGDARSHERPLRPIIEALESLGVEINHGGTYRLPLTITGKGALAGGEITIDASSSSQFISALLLAAPAMNGDLIIRHKGDRLPSMPHIEMTIAMLRARGLHIEVQSNDVTGERSWQVFQSQGMSEQTELVIEPDLSNAAPFLAAGLVVGGKIRIKDWPRSTTQPGDALRDVFAQMGGVFTRVGDDLELRSAGRSQVKGIDIDLHDLGELTPTIAAVAAFANSPSHLRGIGHLRLHETDRLKAITNELEKLGAHVTQEEDGLQIAPAPMSSPVEGREILIESYDDHRMATLGAICGLLIPKVKVANIKTTEKTIPDFPGLWQGLISSLSHEEKI
jgi:3-phosphoshikimate 1-carboxyvinyltransferase